MKTSYPNARHNDLVLQELDGETLVYDTTNAQANLLNRTAAVIWKLCDGKTSVTDLAARASRQLNAPVDTDLVWYTLQQLSSKNLLQERAALPANMKGMTRRDFLRAGLVGAAVVLPVVVSVTAPHPASAATCTQGGQPCTTPSQCCSGVCNGGTCQA